MSDLKKDYKFQSYLIILLALFILVLFTKTQITNIQQNKDINEEKTIEAQKVRAELDELNKVKKTFDSDSTEINKYLKGFKEDEIIDYLYGYSKDLNKNGTNLIIRGLSFSEPSVNEFGFNEVTINVDASVASENVMKKFLNFLVSDDSEYKFMISSFSYPNDNRGSFSINIPLKMFFKK